MDQADELIKNYIKTLPIWDPFDRLQVRIKLLKNDLDSFFNRTIDGLEGAKNLPKLNLSNQPKVVPLSSAQDDMDVVKIYKKHPGGGYAEVDREKCKELEKKAKQDPFRDESVLLLEEKILVGEELYAMEKPGKAWVHCKVLSIYKKPARDGSRVPATIFRLRRLKHSPSRILNVDKYSIARDQDHGRSLKPPKRVIAGLTRSVMFPGIIGMAPDEENKGRYLVLLDDGSARYFEPKQVLPIFGQTCYPWLDARQLRNENHLVEAHLKHYFSNYPKRNVLRCKLHDEVDIARNGVFVSAQVIGKDCDIIRLRYKDQSEESVYRGSSRLLRRTSFISQQLAVLKDTGHFDTVLLMYLHLYEQSSRRALGEDDIANAFKSISISNNKARKSTSARHSGVAIKNVSLDSYKVSTADKEVERFLNNQTEYERSHKCTPDCLSIPGKKTELEIKDIIGEFRDVSDLKIPLLYGWKRAVIKESQKKKNYIVHYVTPCGKIHTKPYYLSKHLYAVNSKFDIDYFSFDREIRLDIDNGNLKAYKYIQNIAVDSKTGEPLENKYISLINVYSEEGLPFGFEYRSKRFPHPHLVKKNFSFNTEFKSGCDCEDDCSQRCNCSCMRLTEEFSGKPKYQTGTINHEFQYKSKRLDKQIITGLFECNSFCSCSSKCPNRVVQNGIRFRLQVQKTVSKGWGVITLDDIPKGAFICTYAAELLDDADQYGDSDMYFADLDYISLVEEGKFSQSDDDEGVGEDSDESGAENGKTGNGMDIDDDSMDSERKNSTDSSSTSSDSTSAKYLPKPAKQTDNQKRKDVRYPERKRPRQSDNIQNIPKTKPKKFLRIHDILESHDFTLDARIQGNVGRYFNHSCDPNTSVQNVFIETHDLRFPEVAFFAFKTIKALEEITWNYNYKMGAIEGRRIDCHCGASNCKGRIL